MVVAQCDEREKKNNLPYYAFFPITAALVLDKQLPQASVILSFSTGDVEFKLDVPLFPIVSFFIDASSESVVVASASTSTIFTTALPSNTRRTLSWSQSPRGAELDVDGLAKASQKADPSFDNRVCEAIEASIACVWAVDSSDDDGGDGLADGERRGEEGGEG